MATNGITSATGSSGTNPLSNLTQQSQMPAQTMTQDDFIKLLVAQMTTQDPLKPMDDSSSFAQLASFSALEQNKAMAASMSTLQASSMIGNYVTVTDSQGNTSSGQVSQVQIINGEPRILVNGQDFTMDQVISISTSQTGANSGATTSGAIPPATTASTTSTTSVPTTITPQLGSAPTAGLPSSLGTAPSLTVPVSTGTAPSLPVMATLGSAPGI